MASQLHRSIWLMALLLADLSSPQAQELRRIHYGTTTSTAHLPIWVAKDAGLFGKHGLNVEPVVVAARLVETADPQAADAGLQCEPALEERTRGLGVEGRRREHDQPGDGEEESAHGR